MAFGANPQQSYARGQRPVRSAALQLANGNDALQRLELQGEMHRRHADGRLEKLEQRLEAFTAKAPAWWNELQGQLDGLHETVQGLVQRVEQLTAIAGAQLVPRGDVVPIAPLPAGTSSSSSALTRRIDSIDSRVKCVEDCVEQLMQRLELPQLPDRTNIVAFQPMRPAEQTLFGRGSSAEVLEGEEAHKRSPARVASPAQWEPLRGADWQQDLDGEEYTADEEADVDNYSPMRQPSWEQGATDDDRPVGELDLPRGAPEQAVVERHDASEDEHSELRHGFAELCARLNMVEDQCDFTEKRVLLAVETQRIHEGMQSDYVDSFESRVVGVEQGLDELAKGFGRVCEEIQDLRARLEEE